MRRPSPIPIVAVIRFREGLCDFVFDFFWPCGSRARPAPRRRSGSRSRHRRQRRRFAGTSCAAPAAAAPKNERAGIVAVPSSCQNALSLLEPTYARSSLTTLCSIESRISPVSSNGESPVVFWAIVAGFSGCPSIIVGADDTLRLGLDDLRRLFQGMPLGLGDASAMPAPAMNAANVSRENSFTSEILPS